MAKNGRPSWNPLSARSWAEALGLVQVPLFARARRKLPDGEQSVLLDGRTASVAFLSGDRSLVYDDAPLSWSWSSNLKYSLIVSEASDALFIRAWDSDGAQKRRLPRSPLEAANLHEEIEKAKVTASAATVISRMLRAFKAVRSIVTPYTEDNLSAIQIFNALLLAAERVVVGPVDEVALTRCDTVADVLSFAGYATELVSSHPDLASAHIGDIQALFTERDAVTNCVLHPDLLIRHASGTLFQEAHFELERQAALPTLFGLEPTKTAKGVRRKDARFTPPELARSLVEQALVATTLKPSLDILDPACGSGVFLQECIRELDARGYRGSVHLRGFDTSPVSVEIARFCLSRAAQEAANSNMTVTYQIESANALEVDWASPDIILMNPPFAGFKDMDEKDQELTRKVLDTASYGHVDKAMAFVWRAATALNGIGVLSCILPSPLLESTNAISWRRHLLQKGDIRAVGKFNGYSFFTGAMVEPAFVVFDFRKGDARPPAAVVMAEQGREGRALRALRKGPDMVRGDVEGVEIAFDVEQGWFTETSWLPKNRRHARVLAMLEEADTPRVGDLFDVKQGTITGSNKTFVISDEQYNALETATEKSLFRLAAGTSTIRLGELAPVEYVFYPYDTSGLLLATEEEVQARGPWFFANRLGPNRDELRRRRDKDELWWTLTEPRSWQRAPTSKLVSAYFGDAGSFAYDHRGEYIVVQGYGWLRRNPVIATVETSEEGIEEERSLEFDSTNSPWAYVALLNSRVFELLLSCFCPRVQGGQFNLSKRFVMNVFLPDLFDDERVSAETIDQLKELGWRMASGSDWNDYKLTELVARAYGVSVDLWDLPEPGPQEWQR